MVGGVEMKERVARTLLEEPGQGGRTENTSGPGRIRMGRDLCLRLSLCSCLRVAVKKVDRPSNTEKYLTKPKLR